LLQEIPDKVGEELLTILKENADKSHEFSHMPGPARQRPIRGLMRYPPQQQYARPPLAQMMSHGAPMFQAQAQWNPRDQYRGNQYQPPRGYPM
jgi:hypothetical protein